MVLGGSKSKKGHLRQRLIHGNSSISRDMQPSVIVEMNDVPHRSLRAYLCRREQVLADFGEFALRSQDLDSTLTEACRLVGEALGTGRAKSWRSRKPNGRFSSE